MTGSGPEPNFMAPYAEPDEAIASRLLRELQPAPGSFAPVAARAARAIEGMRRASAHHLSVEAFLREYSLTTREGIALMVLAEALLRTPDPATMDRLIEDRLGLPDFIEHIPQSPDFLATASVRTLGFVSSLLTPRENSGHIIELARRIGRPALRAAMRAAIHLLGKHFIFATSAEAANKRARTEGGLYSFDMLGEGARTRMDAERYAAAYRDAIEQFSPDEPTEGQTHRPGISVKLSALHPRYEPLARPCVVEELVPVLRELARAARRSEMFFTIDAEEADRLELSLDVVAATLQDSELAGWDGFGIAVQAYQKRALAVVEHMISLAEYLDRQITIRLVKGAYWDQEIKRAQERGLADFPVFTRKSMTDLMYLACAKRLLQARPRVFPQFATHNALTIAMIRDMAGGSGGNEFQRLFGMGETTYAQFEHDTPATPCRIYAPVGPSRDLLAYLVRRLMENGASTSFLARVADPDIPIEMLVRHPAAAITPETSRSSRIIAPPLLFGEARLNSPGLEFGHRASLDKLMRDISENAGAGHAAPMIDGEAITGETRPVVSPIDGSVVGSVVLAAEATADLAMEAAAAGFSSWSRTDPARRADCLLRAADLIEQKRGRLVALLQIEGGKTLDDAVAEWREAIDYCRYYAAEARRLLPSRSLPGPVGEANEYSLEGRGVFVAISPWNFPLAIFIGQITAALVCGNTLVAKPAEQTPLIAMEAVRLLQEAGVPRHALHLVTGDGSIGARLVSHAQVGGVVFTGSTETARSINRTLASREGPIVPLIAETGGVNAMIVDSTSLPEQVTDDVLNSAFRSAGQRCSALRHLYVQEDIAGPVLDMISGALETWPVGDPRDPCTRIGPVIDEDACKSLKDYLASTMRDGRRILYAGKAPSSGCYVAPHMIELTDPSELTQEIFGPILHVTRFKAEQTNAALETIGKTGYALTFGVQSRIGATTRMLVEGASSGNIYVNRNMIGAIVGSQPFGGHGLSGTGPKAGGPHYLPRFCRERTTCTNTAAIGGDPALFGASE